MGGEEAGESQGQRKKETKILLTFGLEEAFAFFFFFFSSVVDTIVLPIPDAELQIQGSCVYGGPASYKFYASF